MTTESPPYEVEFDRQGRPLPPPGTRPTSLKWAMVVPLCAVAMLSVFLIINAADSPGPPPTAVIPKLGSTLGLSVSPVNPFVPLVTGGEPPSDILNAIVLPSPATQISSVATGSEPTSFDAAFNYTSSTSQGSLYAFFRTEIAGRGWRIFSVGAPANQKGVEILAQKAGSDGWFWEEGVIIHPTTFSSTNVESTSFRIRLYQASDDA